MLQQYKHNGSDDYCSAARAAQAVPSREQYGLDHPDIDPKDYDANRVKTFYSCCDNYRMGTIQDNHIYIATTPAQHEQLADHTHVEGLSGYFSDQATIDACKTNGASDNTKYNEMCQIVPYRVGGLEGDGDASYKPHIDCLELDRNALYANYGTYDFNAAISKCEANNHLGGGGGNQGYNPYLSEMIDNHTLNHVKENSFSDPTLSHSPNNNPNILTNSIVPEERANKIFADAHVRAQDCVNNNTPNPSPEARNNGFQKNENPVASNTGHATEWRSNTTNNQIAGEFPPQTPTNNVPETQVVAGELPPAPQKEPQNDNSISGTTPDKAQGIDLSKNEPDGKSGNGLAEDAAKKSGAGFDSNNGIT